MWGRLKREIGYNNTLYCITFQVHQLVVSLWTLPSNNIINQSTTLSNLLFYSMLQFHSSILFTFLFSIFYLLFHYNICLTSSFATRAATRAIRSNPHSWFLLAIYFFLHVSKEKNQTFQKGFSLKCCCEFICAVFKSILKSCENELFFDNHKKTF